MVRFPMHVKGKKITLQEVLAVMGPEAVRYCDRQLRLVYLDVVGRAPKGMTMRDFKSQIRTEINGYPMTWQELSPMSEAIEDLNECLIVGTFPGREIDAERVRAEEWDDCCCVIEGFDSSTWSIIVGDPQVEQVLSSTIHLMLSEIQAASSDPT